MVLSEAQKSSFSFVSTETVSISTFPTSILDVPEVLIRKLLRHLFLFPSITTRYFEWKKSGETIGNIIIEMRMSVFDRRRTGLA